MNINDWCVRLGGWKLKYESPTAFLARKREITLTKYKELQEKGWNNT